MGEFFKQLIAQLSAIWEKLSLQQRIIISALVGFMFFGLFGLVLWSGGSGNGSGSSSGMQRLFSDVGIEEMADITEQLDKGGFKYELKYNETAVFVASDQIQTARMALAREGLPARSGTGYELFDNVDLGATDFEQKVKLKRAIEGELTRTIESLNEVETARIHIVMPEGSIFLEEQRAAKASITLALRSGRKLDVGQIRGITYLVSNSVDDLAPENVTIIDQFGKLLTNPYSNDETAMASSRNIELQTNVEMLLQRKVEQLLSGILGPRKSYITIAADLDFDQIQENIELYDPESKVVRSEERDETAVTNAPDGDRTNERSLSNYEIDKTVQQVIHEVGNIKRLTIAAAINGSYTTDAEGVRTFVTRTPEELSNFEALVKSAVGYDLTRGDIVTVVGVQFDEQEGLRLAEVASDMTNSSNIEMIVQVVVLIVILIIALVIIRSLATSMVTAMNPPIPEVEIPNIIDEEEQVVELPKNIARSNELLERVEIMTESDPNTVARIIKDWIADPGTKKD